MVVEKFALGMQDMFTAELVFRSVKLGNFAHHTARSILHVDASHGPNSVIAHGASVLFSALGRSAPDLRVEHLPLWEDQMRQKMEYNLEHVRAKMAALAGNPGSDYMQQFSGIEELAIQAASARALVISAPTWNYGVPWVLKQYFDCILHPGLTFRETPSGPTGLLGEGRPLVVITSSGGSARRDHLTPWLLDVGSMMGFDKPVVVAAPNVAHVNRLQVLEGIATQAEQAAEQVVMHLYDQPACRHKAGVAEDAAEAVEEEAEETGAWGPKRVLRWLRIQGGLSEDCIESVEAARIDSIIFCKASKEDWLNEDLGLHEADATRLLELQPRLLVEVRNAAAENQTPNLH
mmetsp:Transcript_128169/g.255960  ORF Transcript_128169/g.255960 Transcript_128169/m.255960 type:complete len:348 (+) Transcript_128169:1-1044(+)